MTLKEKHYKTQRNYDSTPDMPHSLAKLHVMLAAQFRFYVYFSGQGTSEFTV